MLRAELVGGYRDGAVVSIIASMPDELQYETDVHYPASLYRRSRPLRRTQNGHIAYDIARLESR